MEKKQALTKIVVAKALEEIGIEPGSLSWDDYRDAINHFKVSTIKDAAKKRKTEVLIKEYLKLK